MYNSKLLNSIIDPHESIPFLRLEKGNNERKFSIEDSSIFELYRSAIFFFYKQEKKKKDYLQFQLSKAISKRRNSIVVSEKALFLEK